MGGIQEDSLSPPFKNIIDDFSLFTLNLEKLASWQHSSNRDGIDFARSD